MSKEINSKHNIEFIIQSNDLLVCIYRKWYTKNIWSILENIEFIDHHVNIRGVLYKQNRRVYLMSESINGYKYSGTMLESKPWIPEIKNICDLINKVFKRTFNACLINEYIDGTQKIGFHSDETSSLNDNCIVSLSFGATRKFLLKPKMYSSEFPSNTETFVSNGDLLIMAGLVQEKFMHSIPAEKDVSDKRISLTFRSFNVEK